MMSFIFPPARRRSALGVLLWLSALLCLRLAAPAGATTATSFSLGTYLGARSDDYIRAVAVDASGIYVVGDTYSDNLAGFGGQLKGRTDIFVARLNPSGDGLVWGTYLGGSANETGTGIALDGQGGVWIVGSSNSTDFPTTSDALQGANNGGYDAVLAKLDTATGALHYGSYYGEANTDEARSIAADDQGGLLVTGEGGGDVMVLRIDAASHNVAYAGYFGGTGEDGGYAVAAGPRGYAFITGMTDGPGSTVDFPLINPIQATCGRATAAGSCGQDAFVAAITPNGRLLYSTLLGGGYAGSEIGSGADVGKAIAVDAQGNIYVAGETYAADFPTRSAFQSTKSGADNLADGFLVKISPDGASLLFATYLGGDQHDELRALQLDGQGNVYVAGFSGSRNFPVRSAFQSQIGAGVCGLGGSERSCEDAILARFSPDGALTWSTYLGGGLDDYGYGLTLDSAGRLYLAGSAASSAGQGFPVTAGSLQPAKALGVDGFLLRFGAAAAPPSSPSPVPPSSPPPANGSYRVHIPLVSVN